MPLRWSSSVEHLLADAPVPWSYQARRAEPAAVLTQRRISVTTQASRLAQRAGVVVR